MNRTPHITIEECAERLGVSIWTVRRRITDGTIKAVRVGRLIRIPEQSIGGKVQPWSESVKPAEVAELTEDRLRAIVREEIRAALANGAVGAFEEKK